MRFIKTLCVTTVFIALPAYANKSQEVGELLTKMQAENYVARTIGKNCKSIRAKESVMGRAALALNRELKSKYSKEDIRGAGKYWKNSDRKINGSKLLIQMAGNISDPADFCELGNKEIAAKTYIGSILVSK